MAHTERARIYNSSRQQAHQERKSRKAAQRGLNKQFRRRTREALRTGGVMPVMRPGVDRVVC